MATKIETKQAITPLV